ncbi:MAG TPA: tripartite tricarboxylate transporter TctB family protein [Alphaproteobacteria bacterium]
MKDGEFTPSRGLVSKRMMEIVVAVLFLVVGSIVITDSLRIGAGWHDPEGPEAGYFPFYIGLIMSVASLVTLVQAVLKRPGTGAPFVDAEAMKQVLQVLIPAGVFVLLLNFIGIYVSAALYIIAFMMIVGRYSWTRAVPVGVVVAVVLFFMFEVWFLVPLPKGPLEDFFGY